MADTAVPHGDDSWESKKPTKVHKKEKAKKHHVTGSFVQLQRIETATDLLIWELYP